MIARRGERAAPATWGVDRAGLPSRVRGFRRRACRSANRRPWVLALGAAPALGVPASAAARLPNAVRAPVAARARPEIRSRVRPRALGELPGSAAAACAAGRPSGRRVGAMAALRTKGPGGVARRAAAAWLGSTPRLAFAKQPRADAPYRSGLHFREHR